MSTTNDVMHQMTTTSAAGMISRDTRYANAQLSPVDSAHTATCSRRSPQRRKSAARAAYAPTTNATSPGSRHARARHVATAKLYVARTSAAALRYESATPAMLGSCDWGSLPAAVSGETATRLPHVL
ncbi:hypothetical protein EJB05_33182, partial [Eragrostis curvula]